MFATLRSDKDRDSLYIHRVGSSSAHQACNSCRMRKLKCTGELDGCQRCQLRKANCEYPELHQSKERKRSKTHNVDSRERNPVPTTPPRSRRLTGPVSPSTSPPLRTESTAFGNSTTSQTTQTEPTVDGWVNAVDSLIVAAEDSQASGFAQMAPNPGIWNGCPDVPSFPQGFSLSSHGIHSKNKSGDCDILSSSSTDENGADIDWSLDGFESNDPLLTTWSHSSYIGELPSLQSSSPDSAFAKTGNDTIVLSSGKNHAEQRLESASVAAEINESLHNDSQTANAQCKCISSGLSALEALETENMRDGHRTIDKELRFQKSILVRCNRLLDCRSCSSMSSFMMLLTVLLEKTTTSFERIVQEVRGHEQYHEQMVPSDQSSIRPDFPERSTSDFQLSLKPKLFIRDYEVDEQDESFVFVGLVARQLKMLQTLLVRLNKMAMKSNLGTHCLMLVALEKRTQVQQKICSDFQ